MSLLLLFSLPSLLSGRGILLEFFTGTYDFHPNQTSLPVPPSLLRSQYLLGKSISKRFPSFFQDEYTPYSHKVFSSSDEASLMIAQAHLFGQYFPNSTLSTESSSKWNSFFSNFWPISYFFGKDNPKNATQGDVKSPLPTFSVSPFPLDETPGQLGPCGLTPPAENQAKLTETLRSQEKTFAPLFALLSSEGFSPQMNSSSSKASQMIQTYDLCTSILYQKYTNKSSSGSSLLTSQCEVLLAFVLFSKTEATSPKDLTASQISSILLETFAEKSLAPNLRISFVLSPFAFAQMIRRFLPTGSDCLIEQFRILYHPGYNSTAPPSFRYPCLYRLRPSSSLIINGTLEETTRNFSFFLDGINIDDYTQDLASMKEFASMLGSIEKDLPIERCLGQMTGKSKTNWRLVVLFWISLAVLVLAALRLRKEWKEAQDKMKGELELSGIDLAGEENEREVELLPKKVA